MTVHRVDAIDSAWNPSPELDPRLARVHRGISPYQAYSAAVAEALEPLHEEHRFDAALFPECAAEGYVALERRRAGGPLGSLPMSVMLHSPIEELYRYNRHPRSNPGFWRRTAMELKSVLLADAVCAPSRFVIDRVRSLLIRSGHLRPGRDGEPGGGPGFDADLIRYPLDPADLPPPPTGPIRRDDPPTILFAGRFEHRKAPDDLLRAAAGVMARVPELRLQFAGADGPAPGASPDHRGSYRRWLTAMADLSSSPDPADRLEFLGPIPRADLLRRASGALAVCIPTLWDNLPLTALEVMAVGGCYIGGSNSGLPEIIEHGRNGLITPSGSVQPLAIELQGLLEDPARSIEIGERAAEAARSISAPDRFVDSLIAHLERAAERRRAVRARPAARVSARPWTNDEHGADIRWWTSDGLRPPPETTPIHAAFANDPRLRAVVCWQWPEAPIAFDPRLNLSTLAAPRVVALRHGTTRATWPETGGPSVSHPPNPRAIMLTLLACFEEDPLSVGIVPIWLPDAGRREDTPRLLPLELDGAAKGMEELAAAAPETFAAVAPDLWIHAAMNTGVLAEMDGSRGSRAGRWLAAAKHRVATLHPWVASWARPLWRRLNGR